MLHRKKQVLSRLVLWCGWVRWLSQLSFLNYVLGLNAVSFIIRLWINFDKVDTGVLIKLTTGLIGIFGLCILGRPYNLGIVGLLGSSLLGAWLSDRNCDILPVFKMLLVFLINLLIRSFFTDLKLLSFKKVTTLLTYSSLSKITKQLPLSAFVNIRLCCLILSLIYLMAVKCAFWGFLLYIWEDLFSLKSMLWSSWRNALRSASIKLSISTSNSMENFNKSTCFTLGERQNLRPNRLPVW